jgi:phosphoglycolate phosphatase
LKSDTDKTTKLKDKKAFIFDFDFTLGDSSRGIYECINHGLSRLGFPPVGYEEACKAIGKSLPDTIAYLAGEESRSSAEEFYEYFMEKALEVMVKKCIIYPGVEETLRYLKSRNFTLAIASTKHRHRIEEILEKHGLSEYFSEIVGGEDVSRHKPDPMVLEEIIKNLRLEASDCVYVGDNIVDAMAAERAGVDFIAVLTGPTPQEMLEEYPHLAVINSISDLQEIDV